MSRLATLLRRGGVLPAKTREYRASASAAGTPTVNETQFEYRDGDAKRSTSATFYRGDYANFYPSDDTLDRDEVVREYFMRGWFPPTPVLTRDSRVVAFGSCFAAHIRQHLTNAGYRVLAGSEDGTYIGRMGDGIVSTFAILQQLEWAWSSKVPSIELWHGFDATAFGYDERIRKRTADTLNQADCFIITLGLSEIWYDEPTGEVFWRAVPVAEFDPQRHRFRAASQAENLANLKTIYRLIREHRPDATIVFTLSPIPLTATFRQISCVTASVASKASLRSALDEFIRETEGDAKRFYFPSYEIVLFAFEHPFMEDRKHVHKHVLDFNMKVFEKYFCDARISDNAISDAFRSARRDDRSVARYGHWAVTRARRDRHGIRHRTPPLWFRLLRLAGR